MFELRSEVSKMQMKSQVHFGLWSNSLYILAFPTTLLIFSVGFLMSLFTFFLMKGNPPANLQRTLQHWGSNPWFICFKRKTILKPKSLTKMTVKQFNWGQKWKWKPNFQTLTSSSPCCEREILGAQNFQLPNRRSSIPSYLLPKTFMKNSQTSNIGWGWWLLRSVRLRLIYIRYIYT